MECRKADFARHPLLPVIEEQALENRRRGEAGRHTRSEGVSRRASGHGLSMRQKRVPPVATREVRSLKGRRSLSNRDSYGRTLLELDSWVDRARQDREAFRFHRIVD